MAVVRHKEAIHSGHFMVSEFEAEAQVILLSNGNQVTYIVGSRGASQLGGSLLGIPLGYKAN